MHIVSTELHIEYIPSGQGDAGIANDPRAPTVVFVHGLLGRGKNFGMIAKNLHPFFNCILVDLPNHGLSAHTNIVDYVHMAHSLVHTIINLPNAPSRCHIVGHSMGGKVAMVASLLYPHFVEKLVVEDIAPVETHGASDFRRLIDALFALNLPSLNSKTDADLQLESAGIEPKRVRAFLLQNLVYDSEKTLFWQPNLRALYQNLDAIMDFPLDEDLAFAKASIQSQDFEAPPHLANTNITQINNSTQSNGTEKTAVLYPNPALFISGGRSKYVTPAGIARAQELFPNAQFYTIEEAGHWVHADATDLFTDLILKFFKN